MKKTIALEQALVFHKIKNETGKSSEAAPYLGVVEMRGVISHEEFVAEIVEEGCSASAETVDLVLKTKDSVVRECVGDHGYKVHTEVSLVMPHLSGSLPSPDAEAGVGNELVPRIDLGDDLRLAAADIVPKENREDISELGGVRILSVFTEGLGFTQLKGTMPFSIAGAGFKPSETSSAAVKVVSAKTGVETEAAEVTVADNQHIVAQLDEVLAKGDYKVVVTVTDESAAGNRDASYNVKMLAAPPLPPPEITDVSSPVLETPDLMNAGGTNVATGTRLKSAAKVKLELLSEDSEELIKTYDLEVDEATDTSVSFETVSEDPGEEFPQDGKVRVTLYKADGTTPVASRKVRMHVPGR